MSNIKINDVPQRIQYLATGGQTQFTVPFPFFQNNYIYVWLNGVQLFMGGAPGQYTVSGAGSPSGGLVTFNTPTILNDIVTIEGIMPIDRTSIYSATISNLTGSDLNGDFNREVVMLQQLNTTQKYLQLQYAPWAVISQDLAVTKDRYIPILEAQQVWRMNDEGTFIEPFTIDTTPAPSSSPYIIYEDDPTLEEAQNLGALTSGILKQTVTAGVATLEIAIPGVDYLDPSMPLGTMAYQNANNVNITGGVAALTGGSVQNSPVNPIDLVNKAYADSIAAGFTFKASCVAATTTNLSATYSNGSSGVGATLTRIGNGAISVDGVSPVLNDRICVKNQSSTFQNGVYIVSDVGSAGTPYILTRAVDFDTSAEIVPGSIFFIQDGNTYADTSFVQTELVPVVGTSPILFTQFSQQYPLSMGNGGTGTSLTPVNNSLVYSNASTLALLAPQNSMVLTSSVAGVPTWATTLPADLTIPTPHIASIKDANGNTIWTMNPNTSAVNNWAINNSATGNPVQMAPIGSDTNIGVQWLTKGTGFFDFYSSNTTVPFRWNTGTTNQHTTSWAVPNTAASRTVTLQDADGTMAYLTDRNWVLLGSATANNTSQYVTFNNITTSYRNLLLVYSNVTPQTNGAIFGIQGSLNNASSFLNSSGDYNLQAVLASGTSISTSNNTTNVYFAVTNASTNTGSGTLGCSGSCLFTNFSVAGRTGMIANSWYVTSGLVSANYFANGQITSASVLNALAFVATTGFVASGTFQLYGMS